MRGVKLATLLTLITLVSSLAVIEVTPTTTDYLSDNTFWNGFSELSKLLKPNFIRGAYPSYLSPSSALIVIPLRNYSSYEVMLMREFISSGGLLVIASEESTYSNWLLSGLGSHIRVLNGTLLDPVVNVRNRFFPKVTNLGKYSVFSNVSSLALNVASALSVEYPAKAIAWSSITSFLDVNGNDVKDPEEPAGPLPVVAVEPLGSGELVVISDSSLWINSMIFREGNYEFLNNLVNGREVYVDISGLKTTLHEGLRYFINSYLSTLSSAEVATPLIFILIIAVTIGVRELVKWS